MIIEKTINNILIKAHKGKADQKPVVFFMSDWAKWTEIVEKDIGLFVISYGTPSNYGHIELGLDILK